jgi:integrase
VKHRLNHLVPAVGAAYASEILGLRVEDLDFDTSTVHARSVKNRCRPTIRPDIFPPLAVMIGQTVSRYGIV